MEALCHRRGAKAAAHEERTFAAVVVLGVAVNELLLREHL